MGGMPPEEAGEGIMPAPMGGRNPGGIMPPPIIPGGGPESPCMRMEKKVQRS